MAKSYGASDLWVLLERGMFDATSMTQIPTTCLWVTGLCFLKGDILIRCAFYLKPLWVNLKFLYDVQGFEVSMKSKAVAASALALDLFVGFVQCLYCSRIRSSLHEKLRRK